MHTIPVIIIIMVIIEYAQSIECSTMFQNCINGYCFRVARKNDSTVVTANAMLRVTHERNIGLITPQVQRCRNDRIDSLAEQT